MADQLYLNLWFPSFSDAEMMPRLLSVMKQFPFSQTMPGIGYLAVHPISFGEPSVFEESYDFRTGPEEAVQRASGFLHEDYGYDVEALLDVLVPEQEGHLEQI